MAIRFTPNGALDVATDPQDLPTQTDGKNEVSGAMTRCTNLHLDNQGKASTRLGSVIISDSAIASGQTRMIEQAGVRYEFSGRNIYCNESSIQASLTATPWSAVLYNAYNVDTQSVFAVNGTDRKRISSTTVTEWGIAAPTAAPTASVTPGIATTHDWEKTEVEDEGGKALDPFTENYATDDIDYTYSWEGDDLAGNPVFDADQPEGTVTQAFEASASPEGKVKVKFTYCRKSGTVLECESNASPYLAMSPATGYTLAWTTPTDTQITHVRFYRTLEGMGDYYYDSEYEVGDLWACLTKSNDELGAELETNHDRPPTGTLVFGPNFDGYLFMAKGNKLYNSLPKQPEYWPTDNYVEIGPIRFPCMGGCFYGGQLYVATEIEIFSIQGTSAGVFAPLPMAAQTGTRSAQCFTGIKGQGILHLGPDGIYAFNIGSDVNITNAQFRPIFQGETVGSIPGISLDNLDRCWIVPFRNKVYFGYPAAGSIYPNNVLVTDMTSKKTVHYQYAASFPTAIVDNENNRLIAADTDGNIWVLEKADVLTDGGTAIDWQLETKEFGGLRKYFPRTARYDVALSDVDATANGYIVLDGDVKQIHAITESRKTRKRLITGCTGDRLSIRVAGTGVVDIYSMEAE